MAGGAIVGALKYLVEVDSARAEAEIDKFMAEAQAKVEAAGGDATFRLLADSAKLDAALAEADAEVDRLKAKKAEVKLDADTSALDRAITAAEAEVKALGRQRAEIKIATTGAVQALAELKAVQEMKDRITSDTDRGTKSQLAQNLAVAKLRESYNKAAAEAQKLTRATRPGETGGLEGQRLALSRVRSEMSLMEHEGRRLGANLHNITQDVEGQQPIWRKWADSISKAHINMGPFSTTLKGAAVGAATLAPLLVSLIGSASALAGAVGVGLVGAFGVAAGAMAGLGLTAVGAGIALHQPIHQLGVAHKAATAYADAVQKYGKDSSQAKDKQAQMNSALKGLPPQAQAAVRTLGQMRGEFMKLGGNAIRGDFFNSFAQGIKSAKSLLPAFAQGSRTAFHAASQGFNDWMKGLRSGEASNILSNLMGNFTKDIGPAMAGLGSLGTAFARFISIASNSGPGIASTFQNWAQGIENATGAGTGFAAKVNDMVDKAKSLGRFLTGAGRLMGAFFGAGADSGQQMLDTMTKAENRWTSWMRSVSGRNSLQTFFKESVANTTALFHALAPLGRAFLGFSRAFTPVTTGVLNFVSALGDVVGFASKLAPLRVLFQGIGVAIGTAFVANRIQSWITAVGNALRWLGILPAVVTSETAAMAANTAAIEANTAARAEQDAALAVQDAELAANTGETVANSAAQGGLLARLGTFGGVSGAAVLGVGALAVGLGALSYALAHTHNNIDSARASLAHYHDMTKQIGPSLDAEAKSTRSAAQADKAATEAKDQLYKTTQKFMKGDASLAQVQQAQSRVTHTQQQATAANKQTVTTQRAMVTSSERVAQAQKAVRDATNAVATAQGKSAVAGRAGPQAAASVAREAAAAQKALAAANVDLAQAQQRQTFDQVNQARAMHGLGPIAQNVAKDFGHLQEVIGKQNAVKLAISASPAQTAQIAKISSDLRKLGGTHKARLIIQGAKSPEEAIKGLQRLDAQQLRKKVLRVESAGATHAAQANLSKVDAKQLKQKALRILTNTGNVTAAIAAITGKKLPPKTQRFNKNGDAAVLSTYQQIAGLPDTTVTTTFQGVKKGFWGAGGGNFAGGVVPGFASGGYIERMMTRAHALAGERGGLDPRSGARVRSPRYIVGEEQGRTEYIITDNPAYRQSNLGFLMEAARALGAAVAVPGYKKGKGGDKKALQQAKKGINAAPSTDAVNQWDSLQEEQQYWADEYDLDRRSHDSGVGGGGTVGGFSVDDLLGDLGFKVQGYGLVESGSGEVGAYRAMQRLLPTLQGLSKAKLPDYSPGSNLKGKKLRKANAIAKRISDYNSAVDSAKSDYQSTTSRDIDHSIQGLMLDAQELITSSAVANNQDIESMGTARYDALKTFGGNLASAGSGPFSGGGGVGSQSSFPALTTSAAAASAMVSPSGASSVGRRSGGFENDDKHATPGYGGVSITNNFQTQPQDPHIWAQNTVFEIAAAGA